MTFTSAHILICRTDNLGDVVLTLPLAAYLKRLQPAIKISFLCRAYAAPLVRCCQSIDAVIELEKLTDPAAWFAQSGVDTVIFCKPHTALAFVAKKARIPNRIGTSHRLVHWFTCNRLVHFSRVKSTLHEAQLNFSLLRPLGIDTIPPLDALPALFQLRAPPMPAIEQLLSKDKFNLILHPKSNGNGREWPITHYLELAQRLQDETAVQCWITGSPAEGTWIEQHAAALLALPNVTNLCGRFALDGLLALIAAADGLIASGTGPLHISAALGKPTLGLFPPMKPIHPGRWGPIGAQAEVLCQANGCGVCADASRCSCMQAIPPADVLHVVQRWKNKIT